MPHKTYDPFKRVIDIVGALAGLILLAPIIVAVAILVRWKLGSPVLFSQDRPGLEGRIFRMYKFRSMTDARGRDGKLLPDAERLPAFGRWLRATSLDELPELWNVLRGEMSLVGPRPLLVRYLPRYSPHQARRHEVRPGITGLAQVRGRNDLSWPEKFNLDVYYVDHRSLWLDLRIILETLWRLARPKGVQKPGHATTEEFLGDQ